MPLFLVELLGISWNIEGWIRLRPGDREIAALALSSKWRHNPVHRTGTQCRCRLPASGSGGNSTLWLLFLSGLTCMAMEVVWVRSYTPYFGTVVYAFASILGVYLLGTFIGSVIYRRWSLLRTKENPLVWSVLATCAAAAADRGQSINKDGSTRCAWSWAWACLPDCWDF